MVWCNFNPIRVHLPISDACKRFGKKWGGGDSENHTSDVTWARM